MRRLKVLISYEGTYLGYADAFDKAVRHADPDADVRLASPADLAASLQRFEPHLVISDAPADAFPSFATGAWFALSPEPDEPSEVRVGSRRWVCSNPGVGALSRVVGAVGGLVRDGRYSTTV